MSGQSEPSEFHIPDLFSKPTASTASASTTTTPALFTPAAALSNPVAGGSLMSQARNHLGQSASTGGNSNAIIIPDLFGNAQKSVGGEKAASADLSSLAQRHLSLGAGKESHNGGGAAVIPDLFGTGSPGPTTAAKSAADADLSLLSALKLADEVKLQEKAAGGKTTSKTAAADSKRGRRKRCHEDVLMIEPIAVAKASR